MREGKREGPQAPCHRARRPLDCRSGTNNTAGVNSIMTRAGLLPQPAALKLNSFDHATGTPSPWIRGRTRQK